jgi:hypothetical protein
VSDLPLQ